MDWERESEVIRPLDRGLLRYPSNPQTRGGVAIVFTNNNNNKESHASPVFQSSGCASLLWGGQRESAGLGGGRRDSGRRGGGERRAG